MVSRLKLHCSTFPNFFTSLTQFLCLALLKFLQFLFFCNNKKQSQRYLRARPWHRSLINPYLVLIKVFNETNIYFSPFCKRVGKNSCSISLFKNYSSTSYGAQEPDPEISARTQPNAKVVPKQSGQNQHRLVSGWSSTSYFSFVRIE